MNSFRFKDWAAYQAGREVDEIKPSRAKVESVFVVEGEVLAYFEDPDLLVAVRQGRAWLEENALSLVEEHGANVLPYMTEMRDTLDLVLGGKSMPVQVTVSEEGVLADDIAIFGSADNDGEHQIVQHHTAQSVIPIEDWNWSEKAPAYPAPVGPRNWLVAHTPVDTGKVKAEILASAVKDYSTDAVARARARAATELQADAAKRAAEAVRAYDLWFKGDKKVMTEATPPPTCINLDDDPELAMLYEVVNEDTGEVVPDVFQVDTKEGVAWQYLKEDNGTLRMEGSRPKMRRVTGSLTLRRIG